MSEHVRVRMPAEREWLGREAVADFERCWQFMNRTLGNMPRWLLVSITWDSAESSADYQNALLKIGMAAPAASRNARSFMLHAAAREMARMGLLELSRGAAAKEESRFLLEGMSEILAHDFEQTHRNLASAWFISHLLDRNKSLGLSQQARWPADAGAGHSHFTAAPGITFLVTCRDLRGRESALKLFESLRKTSLAGALWNAFRTRPEELESLWLKRVREYDLASEITSTATEGSSFLASTNASPAGRAGITLQLRLQVDSSSFMLPEELVILDVPTGRLIQARAVVEEKERFVSAELPIDPGRAAGSYEVIIAGVDESGNLRSFRLPYSIRN